MSKSPIFEFIDETLAGAVPEVLGLWKTGPLPSSETMAFNAIQSGTSENLAATVWRVNLPVNLDMATAHLAQGKHALTQSRQAMQRAPEQIIDLINTKVSASSQSFGTPSDRSDVEQVLLTVINVLQPKEPDISFGLKEQFSETWQQTTGQFQAFGEQLTKSFTQYVRVETCVQGKYLGRSHVGWIGDISTAWRRDVSKDHIKLHQEALELALASRDSMMQSFALAVRVAAQLAALIASPGSAVLLMPRVWRYIQQIASYENS